MFPGRIVADKYRVLRVLGRGGMGVVSEAERIDTGEHFALKFLREDVESELQPNERFFREAGLATKLKSPHACRILGVSEWELGPFIIMELLDGRPLNAILDPGYPMRWPQAARIVYEACHALTEAHALGIVHRDIKPGNLFLAWSAEGRTITKVLDFGVAKIPSGVVTMGGGPSLTDAALLLGTPAYVAPEQLSNSKLVDARADIWALGVMLYEMLSGRLPFQSPLVPKLLVMIAREDPPALSSLMPELPRELVDIVTRCLSKAPSLRFESASLLATALEPFANHPQNELEPLLRAASLRPIRLTSSLPAPLDLHEDNDLEATSQTRTHPDSLGPHTTARLVRPVSEHRSTYSWLSGAAVVAILISTGAYIISTRLTLSRHTSAEQSGHPPQPYERSTTRTVPLSIQPLGTKALVCLDGVTFPSAPLALVGTSDSLPHQLRVEAEGYQPAELTFAYANADKIAIVLLPVVAQLLKPAPERAKAPEASRNRASLLPATAAAQATTPSKMANSPVATARRIDDSNPF